MFKIKSKCGYTVYKTKGTETFRLGGMGICDECNEHAEHGYLIPVLNHFMCPKCYEKWNERAIYYPEDIPCEEINAHYYEMMIPLHSFDRMEVETIETSDTVDKSSKDFS